VKYGALSVPEGRVLVEWTILEEGCDEPMLTIRWSETGGPRVEEPHSRGFGSTVIERHAASAFGGSVDLSFAGEGLVWTLTAPLRAFEMEYEKAEH